MLASGRPVITNASPGSALANIVSQCGFAVEPANPSTFAVAIQKLASDANLRKSLGAAGRQYAQHHLDKEKILSSFEATLKES
jgi:colanic acid biosynthesis glycosyl transferase WcaI